MSDDGGFDAFYESCRDRLVSQVFLLTGDVNDARDIVQQAFEKAWQHWDRIVVMRDKEAWVRLVAFNLAKNHMRWLRRRRPATVRAWVPDPSDQGDAAIELAQALASLTAAHRRALILHHLVGLSVEEIAAEMSARPGTVMSWLHRGRRALAAALAELAPVDGETGIEPGRGRPAP